MKNPLPPIIFITLITLLLTACTPQKETADAGFPQRLAAFNESIKTMEAPDDTSRNAGIRVGSVNMGMNGEWFSEVMNGISDAARDQGVTVTMLDSEGDDEKEKENIDRLLEQGIDVLIISPRDSEGSIPALEKVKAAGIPIVTWNTSVNMDITSFVCVNSKALGGDTGDYMCEYIRTNSLKDQKLIIVDNKNYDVGIARCDGFKESIRDMVETGIIEVVAEDDAETYDASYELVSRLIKEHPETTMLWDWNQPSLIGAIAALRDAGRDDVVVMGTDMSMDLARDMLDENINLQAITTQMPYNMGYKALVIGVKAARGEPVDRKVEVPLYTYKKTDKDFIQRYIEIHKDIVDF